MLDIEKLMREGKSLEEIGKMVTDEMNAAQTKIDAEKEAARIAAEKKAEAKKASKRKADAREAVVAAFKSYLTLVLGEEIHEDIIRTAIVDLEQSIDTIKNLKVSVNGNEFKSIFDLIF
jgi:hypothetical protein